ncbi:MAG TPA: SUMF1/EgtB/PvdO family nonheme iron enzyme [Chloroflexia bacterium]|nr:SUMF1/EgtB/PvdO family nonheme iron enzyme [Chloroflexia bacterium]
MPSEWVGRELAEYFVFERIGAGSMAEVYKALQPSMDRMVGIKILSAGLAHDPQFVARFRREVQIVASLEHPHILPVIDFGERDNTLYLVMRYVNGGTLHDLIEQGPMQPSTVLRYLTEIGEAIDYAHERRVVHRDIKPRNVLLDQQGNPFIADFGLAKLIESGGITNSGLEMIGTPHYMSPEQARGQPVDGRSDLYSLGVLLFQMLTGRVPFDGDSTVGIVMKHINAPVPDVTESWPTLPPALNSVVAKAMSKEPDNRYPTAQALTGAVAEALGTSVLAGPIVSNSLVPGKKRRAWPAGRGSLTVWRKLGILAQWGGRRLVGRQSGPESLGDVFGRLFPLRSQRRLLFGGALVALVGLFVVLSGLRGLGTAPPLVPAAAASQTAAALLPASTATSPASPSPVPPTGTLAPTATQAASATAPPTATAPPPSATPVPTVQVVTRLISEQDGMALLLVPAGPFKFGSRPTDDGAREDEQPQQTINLDAFWIDRTEVTVAQFTQFVAATRYKTDAERGCCAEDFGQLGGHVYSPDQLFVVNATWLLPQGGGAPAASPKLPVVQVSWNDAGAYCAWAGRRLPTEAEWEKAARGDNGMIYPWGNEFDGRKLNACDSNCSANWHSTADDTFSRTGTVGVFVTGASPYGVVDMAGNVREWVNDFYDFRGYSGIPTANPPGLESGLTRVLRGGSWLDPAEKVRAAGRDFAVPDLRDDLTGFRCAVSDQP